VSERTVEDRLKLLEDARDIEALIGDYAFFIDHGWPGAGSDPEAVAQLFTDDAQIASDGRDPLVGREAILAWVRGISSMEGLLVSHTLATPQLTIRDDDAVGRWHGIVGMRIGANDPAWLVGNYEYQFVRTSKGWKIAHQRFCTAYQSAFDGSNWTPGNLPG
jgi:ketosteroid isomerase-like protein